MKQSNEIGFFEAMGLEGSAREMMLQIAVGAALGLALLLVVGLADAIGTMLERL